MATPAEAARPRPAPHPSGFAALARLESLSARGMKLGLAAIDAVCERLGRPERRVPAVLIAGTNGKGSTAATLASIAAASGVRGGLYTSPHLIGVTERIRVKEADVSPEELDEALTEVFGAAGQAPEVPLTYFEALTAAAFATFARRSLDLAILEVGLGGRFDATNVAPAVAAIVTSIGLDHTEELGATLAGIAREKAGIFRRGRPALARAESSDAMGALRDSANAVGAGWHDASDELSLRILDVGIAGTRFELSTPQRRGCFWTPLAGEHQAWNAALAIRAAELMRGELDLSLDRFLEEGVVATRWPGRLEEIRIAGREVILDGCHNAPGAAALARFLDDSGLSGGCRLVFGAMADKDIESMAAELFPRARSVVLVGGSSSRAASPEELLRRAGTFGHSAALERSVASALPALLARREPEPIVVAGSLYLVGEARALLLSGRWEKELA